MGISSLVLNHSGSGSVTANHSHGNPLELTPEYELLTKWADLAKRRAKTELAGEPLRR